MTLTFDFGCHTVFIKLFLVLYLSNQNSVEFMSFQFAAGDIKFAENMLLLSCPFTSALFCLMQGSTGFCAWIFNVFQ